MIKFKPLGDHIVITTKQPETTTNSGIILPEKSIERPDEGIVVAVSEGVYNYEGKLIPLDVKVNDRVLFNNFSGKEIKIDDEKYLLLGQNDIFGILED